MTKPWNYIVLNSAKVYDAQIANNQPNYQERGLVFCDGILLDNTEYEVVKRGVS